MSTLFLYFFSVKSSLLSTRKLLKTNFKKKRRLTNTVSLSILSNGEKYRESNETPKIVTNFSKQIVRSYLCRYRETDTHTHTHYPGDERILLLQ